MYINKGGDKMTEKELSADMKILDDIISQICNYAIDNDLEPDETIETIAENLLTLCKIASFNDWQKED